MKTFFLVSAASAVFLPFAYGGSDPLSNKAMTAPPPCPSWYADTELNVGIWGAGAFTGKDYPTLENTFALDVPNHDRYLETDHAWGGGMDAKYFFKRYFGLGIEGFVLDARQSYPDIYADFFALGSNVNHARTSHNRQAIGAGLATFSFRYPIGCSRFAPYAWIGGGVIFGGGQVTRVDTTSRGDIAFTTRSGPEAKAVGQFGGGLEVRLTRHIGVTSDFSWNIVNGTENNFGMARTGINFAF